MPASKSSKWWFIGGIVAVLLITFAFVLYFAIGTRSLARDYTAAVQAFDRGESDEAIRLLEQIIAQDPTNEEAFRLLAKSAHKTGEYPLSARAWTNAAYLNPLDKTLPIIREKTRFLAAMYPLVIASIDPKIDDNSATDEERVVYAHAQMRTGNLEKATMVIEGISPKFDSADLRLLQADVAFANKQLSDAKQRYQSLTQDSLDTIRAAAYMGLAAIAEVQNQPEQTLDALLEASKQNPYLPSLAIGEFYMTVEAFDKAKLPLQRAVKAYNSTTAIVDLAEVYTALRDKEALSALIKGTEPIDRKMTETMYYMESMLAFLEGRINTLREKLILCTTYQSRALYRLMVLPCAIAENNPAAIGEAITRLLQSSNSDQTRAHVISLLAPVFTQALKDDNTRLAEGLARALVATGASANANVQQAKAFLMRYDVAQGNFANARILAAETLREDPENPLACEIMGQVLLGTREPRQALSYFKGLHERFPTQAAFLAGMGQAEAELGNIDAAAAHFYAFWQTAPAHPDVFIPYAQFLLKNQRFEAVQPLTQTLEKQTDPVVAAWGPFFAGQVAELQRLPEKAIADYRASLQKNPKFAAAYLSLCALLPPEQAIDLLRKATEQLPDENELLYRLAFLLAEQNRDREAADIYRELLKRAPNSPAVLLNFSEILASLGEKKEALQYAKSAYTQFPDLPAAAECFGVRLFESQDYTAAIDILESALLMQPESARVKNTLIDALRQAAQQAERRDDILLQERYYTKLQTLLPSDKMAAEALARLEQKRAEQQQKLNP